MSTTIRPAPSAGSVLDAIERRAWRIRLPTRRLIVVLAGATAGAVIVASLTAAWVAARNNATIHQARVEGLGVASAATEFRTSLAAADAEAFGSLISGGIAAPPADQTDQAGNEETYATHLAAASQALADAALAGTSADAEDLRALSAGLSEYSGLVESARANSLQGFPVGASYMGLAHQLASDELVPRANHLRREGEQRVARAAASVSGPFGVLAVVLLMLAALAVVGASAIIAGRTRRMLHPALVAAAVFALVSTAVMAFGIARQFSQLRAAATDEVDTYFDANDISYALAQARVTEISAVAARGSGAPLYEQFHQGTADLDNLVAGTDLADAVQRYEDGAAQVESADMNGDNRGAATIALTGDSSTGYQAAAAAVTSDVKQAGDALADRIDGAEAASIPPLVPLGLGAFAAGLAAAGILYRGRRYR
jgi:hypothetical protein